LGVRALNKIGLFLILFSLGFFGKKENVPHIQRAVVTEHQAIIYTHPDFDSEQMMRLSNNKIIAISTKIYRPKNLFGSFYRIFINKPRKVRGYISEIDVLPQYKKTRDGYVLNKKYAKKEQALKQMKTQLVRTGGSVQADPKVLDQKVQESQVSDNKGTVEEPSMQKGLPTQEPGRKKELPENQTSESEISEPETSEISEPETSEISEPETSEFETSESKTSKSETSNVEGASEKQGLSNE